MPNATPFLLEWLNISSDVTCFAVLPIVDGVTYLGLY